MKRSKQQLIIEFLEISSKECTKTELVYKSMTNFTIIKKYLDALLKANLITQSSEKYLITDKGRIYLEKAKSLIL